MGHSSSLLASSSKTALGTAENPLPDYISERPASYCCSQKQAPFPLPGLTVHSFRAQKTPFASLPFPRESFEADFMGHNSSTHCGKSPALLSPNCLQILSPGATVKDKQLFTRSRKIRAVAANTWKGRRNKMKILCKSRLKLRTGGKSLRASFIQVFCCKPADAKPWQGCPSAPSGFSLSLGSSSRRSASASPGELN